ncbi:hypothetical protein M2404_004058 [Rheinheimera pacifica]|uniref:hypothetical protein n=1 Tax=Rheinheimera pacifica TaxID=173990 RepID=UPI002169380B|nr:hypothetical protein [Rheinheimera pacifica]MCS4309681.1 hypothetical protein [Rheinheimera pacifica]
MMKKSIFLFWALTAFAVSQPVAAVELSEPVYVLDVIVGKGEQTISHSAVRLTAMRHGQTATATFGGKTVKLKYSGLASVAESNGKTDLHEFLYVTEENQLVVDIYQSDCGQMALRTAWPLLQSEYQVQSASGDCILTVKMINM